MKTTKHPPRPIQIKDYKLGELRAARLKSALYAYEFLTAQQVHRQMTKNGCALKANRFYDGRSTPEDSFRLLNAQS
jgi:hypothetical protein